MYAKSVACLDEETEERGGSGRERREKWDGSSGKALAGGGRKKRPGALRCDQGTRNTSAESIN